MASTDQSTEPTGQTPSTLGVDMKLEVVTLPVSDVDRAKDFYQSLGWRLDADFAVGDDIRAVQLTPPHSGCSISFGKGLTTAAPGSAQRTELVVSDIEAAREDSSAAASRSARCSTATGASFFQARTRNIAPISPTPLSAIRMATAGSSKRSPRGFRAGCGRNDDRRRFPSSAAISTRCRGAKTGFVGPPGSAS